MKSIHVLIFIAFVFAGLSGCSSNESSDPEDTLYQLFPNGYFSEGFREEYGVSGTSPSGLTLEGTHLELTAEEQSFNGEQVSVVRTQNDWVDNQTNQQFSNAALSFYSTVSADRKLVGSEDLITGVVSSSTSEERLPESASIGESGLVGSYTDTAGSSIMQTWRLEEANDGFAKIIWASQVRDDQGNLILEGETAYIIDRDGNRQSLELLFDVKQLNDPVSWVGVKR